MARPKSAAGATVLVVCCTLALAALLAVPVDAAKHTLNLSGDQRAVIPVGQFGLQQGGSIELSVENFKATGHKAGLMGFLFRAWGTRSQSMEAQMTVCRLDNSTWGQNAQDSTKPTLVALFEKDLSSPSQFRVTDETFVDLIAISGPTNNTIKMTLTSDKGEGEYNIYFVNCDSLGTGKTASSVSVTIHLTEVNMDGKQITYLAAWERPLPVIYFVFAGIFLVMNIVWIDNLRRNREKTNKLHILMALLVFLKVVSDFADGMKYHTIAHSGNIHEAWGIVYYIFRFLNILFLFTIVALISAGWAFIKPFLGTKEKRILMAVIPLQILVNIAHIVTSEEERGQAGFSMWQTSFYAIDLICCFCVIYPIAGSIKHLRDAAQNGGKAAISMQKLKVFRQFYLFLMLYVYFTRIIVVILVNFFPFKQAWLADVFDESVNLAFFVFVGYKFRPNADNPYFMIPQDDEEIPMMDVQD
eukprot:Opistho-2@21172